MHGQVSATQLRNHIAASLPNTRPPRLQKNVLPCVNYHFTDNFKDSWKQIQQEICCDNTIENRMVRELLQSCPAILVNILL